ncbi:MAG: hypothetical protein KC656_10590 [Myxococcales bacterium]|nr:hypothetical protein [Myxococcales bacterium]MCB9670652.1 hypothetical protein [Alphaproteobacteria bacterium]MCB9693786.1 hypothetical protein [Alphaproteobacteria bacterium]
MRELSRDLFSPRDGAVLDLASLDVLAHTADELLSASLAARWPGCNALVLQGLELVGTPSPSGPPGSVRPDANSRHALVTPGVAILSDRLGRKHVLTVQDEIHVPWPDASGPRVRGVLSLLASRAEAVSEGGIAVARESLEVKVGFVKPGQSDQVNLLAIAQATGNGQDWATDVARVLQPEHDVVRTLLKRFERLEQSVWKAEPEGAVWDRQILGRSWVRYQTVAASALQAARMQLATQATTTLERVRVMRELRLQLERSVERTATELLQLVGPVEGAGPYGAVATTR